MRVLGIVEATPSSTTLWFSHYSKAGLAPMSSSIPAAITESHQLIGLHTAENLFFMVLEAEKSKITVSVDSVFPRQWSFHCVFPGQNGLASFLESLIRSLILSWSLNPWYLVTSQRLHLLPPPPFGLGFQHMNGGSGGGGGGGQGVHKYSDNSTWWRKSWLQPQVTAISPECAWDGFPLREPTAPGDVIAIQSYKNLFIRFFVPAAKEQRANLHLCPCIAWTFFKQSKTHRYLRRLTLYKAPVIFLLHTSSFT